MYRSPLLVALALAGCSGAEAAKLAQARIDTLPNGVVRVMSEAPRRGAIPPAPPSSRPPAFKEDGTPAELGQPRSLRRRGRVMSWTEARRDQGLHPDGQLVRR
jgi:hypothetical protein